MAKLLERTDLFEIIAKIVADYVFEYHPSEDKCIFYKIEDGGLQLFQEVDGWREVFYHCTHVNSHKVLDEMFRMIDVRAEEGDYELQLIRGYEGKTNSWVHCAQKYIADEDYYIAYVGRIDERMKENLKLFEETKKDPLTKLLNKAYSAQIIAESIACNAKGVLFIIDVDNFKAVNDTMGHMFGDEVIISVANGIKAAFRDSDYVGRIGGDEFIAYVENLTDRELIRRKAEQVCKTVAGIYTGKHENVKISASIGIALAPEHADNYHDLFEQADQALYYTKRKGKNGYTYYDAKNEAMKQHSQMPLKRKEIQSDIEVDEEMDQFYSELNELAFRLLQETKDADSAIHLLLHKIQDKFEFSAIRILEETGQVKELTCTYELCVDDIKPVLGTCFAYNEAQWTTLNNLCNREPFIYYQSKYENLPSIFKVKDTIKAGMIVPVVNNSCFCGVIMFEDCQTERKFTLKERKILKSFERIFSVYRTKKLTNENNDYYIRQFVERDAVTGVLVHAAFLKKMEEVIYDIPGDCKLVYVQADIAKFKYVNESFGYDVGNRLVNVLVSLLATAEEFLLTAGRIHSDNLVIVFKVPGIYKDEEILASLDEHLGIIDKKLNEIVPSVNVHANCGVYITKGTDYHYNKAIDYAEYAKKIAKENNSLNCVCFDKEMMEAHQKELFLQDTCSQALENGLVEVYYQPMVDSVSKVVVGAEALTRWRMPDGNLICPEEYISVLETADKLWELEYFVINKVVQFLKKQEETQEAIVPVSINLSKKHIGDGKFLEYLTSLSEKYQVALNHLLFEIKEEVFISEMNETIEFCNKLREMGIYVMMDCFGAGYSSLNVLDKFPVAYIKIDRVFIKNRTFEKSQEVILRGIVEIATKLKKYTVSIGVETAAQNEFLAQCGCDIIQGNYYSKPLLEQEFLEYAREHAEPEHQEAIFSFDGTLDANLPEYRASINGTMVEFDSETVPGRNVLSFPGGTNAHEVVELNLPGLLNDDFTISMWIQEREKRVWTSVFYADFENTFLSIVPSAWDNVSSLVRIMDKFDDYNIYDAIGVDEPVNGWIHITTVYNKKTATTAIYLNGSLMGCKNEVMKLENPGRIILGGDVYQSSFYGLVSDLHVVNKMMSAMEISQLYDETKHIYQRT